jgi:hypothetical protein
MDFEIDRRELLKATGAGMATVTVTTGAAVAQTNLGNLPGDGSEANPYELDSFEDLLAIDQDLTANYVLTDNIEFGATDPPIEPLAFDGGSYYGYSSTDFTGTLDGQGFEIRDFVIDGASIYDGGGLFGSIGTGGVVKNLNIVNIDVIGDSFAGGLTGKFDGGADGKIKNVSVTGAVESRGSFGINAPSAGGIVGTMLSGTVSDCSSSAGVRGERNLGGAIGDMSGGDVTRTSAEGVINVVVERSSDGGFVGRLSNGTITQCYATGNVNGSADVGGFVGEMEGGEINQAYAWGDVSGFENIGGFVGFLQDGTIEEVYAVGEILAEGGGGGLIGGVPVEGIEEPIFRETDGESITPLQASLDVAYWDEVSTGRTAAIGTGSIPLGSNVEGFSTDSDGDTKADEMTGDDAPDNMVGFDFENTWVTITEGGNSVISFGVDDLSLSQEEDTEGISIAQEREQEGDGYPRFGGTSQKDCTDRRNLGRGQEESECAFDRDIERGGSRRELDRNTGRGGDGEHIDSETSRRDRGRGSRRGR